MKTIILSLSFLSLLIGTSCKKSDANTADNTKTPKEINDFVATGPKIAIALGGNAWVKTTASEQINNNGLANWTNAGAVTSVYFRTETPGIVTVALRMKVPSGNSTFKVSTGTQSITKIA